MPDLGRTPWWRRRWSRDSERRDSERRDSARSWSRDWQQGPLSQLAHNLAAGLRLATFRRVDVAEFRASHDQIFLLVILNVALALASGWLVTVRPLYFNYQAAGSYGVWLAATFLLAYLATFEAQRPGRFSLTAVMLLSPLLLGWALFAAIHGVGLHVMGASEDGCGDVARMLFLLWLMPLCFRALRLGCGLDRTSTATLVGFHVFLSWLAVYQLDYPYFFYTDTWSDYASEPSEAPPRLDTESIFYAQHELLAAVSEGLAPSRPGVTDLYFVGFGADASQSVFMREIRFVRDLFERRFDTAGRSVSLINHADTLEELPLASVSNLSRAIASVGERMGDEDVLFVYLTGHGYQSHKLATTFRNLPLNELEPPRLQAMLDEAEIPWRVVVVSACYSGGFIEDLAGERTLVLTAAAADRQSFGCSEENDFTYFGRAYFAEQLEEQRDFVAAFEAARARIHVWETEEGKAPSMPQMAAAPEIRAKLAELTARLQAAGEPAVALQAAH